MRAKGATGVYLAGIPLEYIQAGSQMARAPEVLEKDVCGSGCYHNSI